MTQRLTFSNKKQPEFHLTKFRIAAGVLLGLFYAFSFYSILYLLRETFRIFSLTEDYNLLVLSTKEVNFYNLFFAFLAVILGQSVCFIYWFDRPKRFFDPINFRKSAIVNDQRAMNWYFLSWFAKLSVVLAISIVSIFRGNFQEFSFLPNYNYMFIMIVMVLFFQSWNMLRLTFIRKSFRWMLVSALIVCILSFGFSRINLVDYEKINTQILSKNIGFWYQLELPVSEISEQVRIKSLTQNIYVVCDKNDNASLNPFVIIDHQKVPIDSLSLKIQMIQKCYDKSEIPYINFRLCIHKDIRMDYVEVIKNVLFKTGISQITYAVTPVIFKTFNRTDKVSFRVKLSDSGTVNPEVIENEINSSPDVLVINEYSDSTVFLNNILIDRSCLKTKLKETLLDKHENTIVYCFAGDTRFADYITVLSGSVMAVQNLRDKFALANYSTKFDMLNLTEREKVKEQIPFRFTEFQMN